MRKRISKALIFILVLQLIVPGFLNKSYAADKKKCEDNPPICTATQPYMQTYLNFQQEMIGVLSTNRFKSVKEDVSEGKGGLFTNELLKLKGYENFDQTLAGITLRIFDITATRSATMLLTALFLFELSAIGALADNTINITILFQDRPIVRDWAKVLDIERLFSDMVYSLGVNGEIGRKVKDTSAIQGVVSKYVGEGLFDSGSSFRGDSYTDILIQLAVLNSSVKWFLAYDSTVGFKNFRDNYQLKIKDSWIQGLEDEYKCARRTFGFKCNRSWANLKKNLKILTRNTNKQGKSSIKQIKNSYQELRAALSNWTALKNNIQGKKIGDNDLSDKEREILRSRYGLNTSRVTKDDGTSILSLSTNLKGRWKSLAKGVKTATTSFVGAVSKFKKMYRESKEDAKFIQDQLSGDVYVGGRFDALFGRNVETGKGTNYTQASLYLNLKDVIEGINKSHMNSYSIVNVSNNIDLSKKYVELYDQIEKLIEAIGDDKKVDSLRLNLKLLCEKQCSNKGSECCYVK